MVPPVSTSIAPTPKAIQPPIIQIKFPDWIKDDPRLANNILTADAIARAKFLSLDSTIKEERGLGHIVELLYKFEVMEYLKGDGDDQLTVRLSSGPKYASFPDWYDNRPKDEARRLAEEWSIRNLNRITHKEDGILLLHRTEDGKDYEFVSYEPGRGYGGYPMGETWLWAGGDSGAIVKARIEDIARLMVGRHPACVLNAIGQRAWVRDRIKETYQELTLGGYRKPDPLPRFIVEIDVEKSEDARILEFRRPPYLAPRFSDYWLDGADKHKFALRVYSEYHNESLLPVLESVVPIQPLPEGEYNIYYVQYHSSLPCGYLHDWWSRDILEVVVRVTAQD